MADPSTYRPRPGEIPTDPGVYRFRDRDGRVIYVGKAKNLRQRLSSYFQDVAALHHRTATMVRTGASVEWTVVTTEVEALQLEYAWIKEFDPRFNVKYRDDKSYPYLAVTLGEEYPRAQVMRGAKRKGTRYFGPYAHAWAIRETLDLALRVFPVRTCSAGVFKRASQVGRPCLLGYIDKCSAPCVGRVDAARHREIAEDFCDFMAGETGRFVTRLTKEMKGAAAELDFERAARLRDDIGALERVLEKSAVVLPDATDADVFALAEDELEVAVQLFHVRGGRVRGQRGWVAERDAETTPEVVEHLLQQVYGSEAGDAVPREVLVPVLPDDAEALSLWLSALRGSRVDLRVPRRGDKRTLMETVARNATQSLARHKVTRAGDLTTRSQALQQLQDALELDEAPLRIECFDISHVQGTRSSARWSSSRTACRASPSTAASSCAATRPGPPTTPPRCTRCSPDGSAAAGPRRPSSPRRRAPRPMPRMPVSRLPRSGRGPRGSPTGPTWSWSTAGCRRSTPRPGRWRTSVSSTSRWSGSPSGSRRSGCRGRSTPWCCPAPARVSTSCSGCATRRTGSRSPSTGSGAPRR